MISTLLYRPMKRKLASTISVATACLLLASFFVSCSPADRRDKEPVGHREGLIGSGAASVVTWKEGDGYIGFSMKNRLNDRGDWGSGSLSQIALGDVLVEIHVDWVRVRFIPAGQEYWVRPEKMLRLELSETPAAEAPIKATDSHSTHSH